MEIRCISCNKDVLSEEGHVRFKCPSCGTFEIIRCNTCRKNSIIYKCKNCGFEGP